MNHIDTMKLALEALETERPYLGPMPSKTSKAITALREALAEQPAQQLPFGVGGGLVAIKTLLSRDPCAHAKVAIEMIDAMLSEQPAQQEPVAWRELCRRLYVELFHCDQQMMATLDEDGEPVWTQGKTVRDVLADAKAALDTSPPAQRKPWVGLTPEQRATIAEANNMLVDDDLFDAIEAELKEKNT